jgi:hypothetical protein
MGSEDATAAGDSEHKEHTSIHHRMLLGGLHGVFTTGVYSGRTYKLELI